MDRPIDSCSRVGLTDPPSRISARNRSGGRSEIDARNAGKVIFQLFQEHSVLNSFPQSFTLSPVQQIGIYDHTPAARFQAVVYVSSIFDKSTRIVC